MNVVTKPPCAELRAFVKSVSVVETKAQAERLLVPDTGATLGLRYAGFARELNRSQDPLPDFALSGLRRRARLMQTSAGGGVVVVTFREAGAAAFFAEPLHELFGDVLDVGSVIAASSLERVRQQLAEARGAAERIALAEQFLLERLEPAESDVVVEAAVGVLHRSHGAVRIDELARSLGLGRDRLEKRFRRLVGTTPKHHASLLRLNRAIALYRPGRRLTDLSLEAGYFDQAHFIRDLRACVGQAPQRFFASAQFC